MNFMSPSQNHRKLLDVKDERLWDILCVGLHLAGNYFPSERHGAVMTMSLGHHKTRGRLQEAVGNIRHSDLDRRPGD